MCRMFAYVGTSKNDLDRLYTALKNASKNDDVARAAGRPVSHDSGWGYALAADNGLFHYRTKTPIFDDEAEFPKFKGRICAIFHSRLARNKPAEHIFSHPFVAATNKEVIFLAHNGSFNVPDENNVDSEWALEQIIKSGGLEASLEQLKTNTKQNSSANIFVMAINRATRQKSIRYLSYDTADSENLKEYYAMYMADMPGGRAIISSTLKLHGIPCTSKIYEGIGSLGEYG